MSTEYIINDGGVNRPMTEKETAEYLELCATIPTPLSKTAQAKADSDKAAARQIVLDRLGITADEAALLLG